MRESKPENADGVDKWDLQGQGHEIEVHDLDCWPEIVVCSQGGEVALFMERQLYPEMCEK